MRQTNSHVKNTTRAISSISVKKTLQLVEAGAHLGFSLPIAAQLTPAPGMSSIRSRTANKSSTPQELKLNEKTKLMY